MTALENEKPHYGWRSSKRQRPSVVKTHTDWRVAVAVVAANRQLDAHIAPEEAQEEWWAESDVANVHAKFADGHCLDEETLVPHMETGCGRK